MANFKVPYVKLREQPDGTIRPRAVHGPRQRAMGFKDQDLKHPNGAWYSFADAREFSDARVKEVAEASLTGRRVTPPPRKGTTMEHLLDDWLASDEVKALSATSIDSYRKAVRAVIFRPESRTDAAQRRKEEKAAALLGVTPREREREPMASATPSSVGAPELRDFYNYLKSVRGHHMALAAIAAISAAFTWGRESTAWRLGRNPRLDMQFDRPDGRVVLITLDEFQALVSAADSVGRHSIGDAIYLGLFTGQRQTDRLALIDAGLTPEGRRKFVQSKTSAIVEIKEAPQLVARLADAAKRVKELKLKLQLRDLPRTIVVDETTGRPYNEHTYRHEFARIRDIALQTCPSLAFINPNSGAPDLKHDQDLRDTCVMMLDRAGNDLLSICDVTGHGYQSAQTIMKNYRARNAARADVAIDKLVAFIGKQEKAG